MLKLGIRPYHQTKHELSTTKNTFQTNANFMNLVSTTALALQKNVLKMHAKECSITHCPYIVQLDS